MNNLLTIRDYIRWGVSYLNSQNVFFGHGCDNPVDEVIFLISYALDFNNDLSEYFFDARLTELEKQKIQSLLKQRAEERIPAAYLTKEAWFAGMPFYVNEHVLVPRSPMAELILNGFYPWLTEESPQNILDLCTGSGCIGIACAQMYPEANVDLVDISTEALQVAEKNIENYQLQDRVHAIQSDLFNELVDKKYDIIISNPPYVDEDEISRMPDEFKSEPVLGLEAGKDGLDIVRKILEQASKYMTENGILFVEVGVSQAALVKAYPDTEFMWVDFENGGEGVFTLQKRQL